MSTRPSRWRRPLAAVAAAALIAGCVPIGRGGPGGQPAGRIVLTSQGAQSTLRGDPGSVAGSVEEVFRTLDIHMVRRDVDGDGGRIEGQVGMETVLVEMSAAEEDRTHVEVRVKGPGGDRWNRAAARGILDEIVSWQAS